MQLAQNSSLEQRLPNRDSVENFIDQSLLGNWSIRVEYAGVNSQGQMGWKLWGNTLFAIGSPSEVLEAIDACHAYYPEQEIRIYAENLRPEMRMVYNVYRAREYA